MTLDISYHTHPGKRRELNEDSFSIFRAAIRYSTLHIALELGMGELPGARGIEACGKFRKESIKSLWTTMKSHFPGSPEIQLLTVADGMGGHLAGEVASGYVVREFPYLAFKELLMNYPHMDDAFSLAVTKINLGIRAMTESDEESYENMGSTLAAALVMDRKAYVVNVGDSRTYRLRNGEPEQISRDHSFVQALMDVDAITPEEAKEHPQRNVITRTMGTKPEVKPEVFEIELEPCDALLLCSDGLTDMVNDDEIREIVSGCGLAAAPQRLVERANENGGKDNITVVMGRVRE